MLKIHEGEFNISKDYNQVLFSLVCYYYWIIEGYNGQVMAIIQKNEFPKCRSLIYLSTYLLSNFNENASNIWKVLSTI